MESKLEQYWDELEQMWSQRRITTHDNYNNSMVKLLEQIQKEFNISSIAMNSNDIEDEVINIYFTVKDYLRA